MNKIFIVIFLSLIVIYFLLEIYSIIKWGGGHFTREVLKREE